MIPTWLFEFFTRLSRERLSRHQAVDDRPRSAISEAVENPDVIQMPRPAMLDELASGGLTHDETLLALGQVIAYLALIEVHEIRRVAAVADITPECARALELLADARELIRKDSGES